MDPNPTRFPILSYVMSRLNSRSPHPDPDSEPDIEQPQIQMQTQEPQRPRFSVDLLESMPHLADPTVLAAMKSAVAEVAQTRSVLQTLGDRPDHESVDVARARLSQIDAALYRSLEDIVRAPRPEGVDVMTWRSVMADQEKECREKAEKVKAPFKAIIELEEMHEAYNNQLKVAEEKLVKIYEGHRLNQDEEDKEKDEGKELVEDDNVNEEVIGILQQERVEKVELSARNLRFLPEEFGRIRGLISLELSNNQLQVPDYRR